MLLIWNRACAGARAFHSDCKWDVSCCSLGGWVGCFRSGGVRCGMLTSTLLSSSPNHIFLTNGTNINPTHAIPTNTATSHHQPHNPIHTIKPSKTVTDIPQMTVSQTYRPRRLRCMDLSKALSSDTCER